MLGGGELSVAPDGTLVIGGEPVLGTSFASDMAVSSLSVDGVGEGTGSGIDVRPDGDVLVYYDNGEALSIGSVALARLRAKRPSRHPATAGT